MWTMTIPRENLTEEVYTILGHLAVDHHAVILNTDAAVTIEMRTVRVGGVDLTGDLLAFMAKVLLVQLAPVASSYDPIPAPPQPIEEENIEA